MFSFMLRTYVTNVYTPKAETIFNKRKSGMLVVHLLIAKYDVCIIFKYKYLLE